MKYFVRVISEGVAVAGKEFVDKTAGLVVPGGWPVVDAHTQAKGYAAQQVGKAPDRTVTAELYELKAVCLPPAPPPPPPMIWKRAEEISQ